MQSEDQGEGPVLGMLADLEMQAEGLHLAERALEVEELTTAQYAEVDLIGRVHASAGRRLHVGTSDGLELHGRLTGSGADWLLLSDAQGVASFVHLGAVATVRDLAPGVLPEAARSLASRLSLRSALRGVAEDRRPCTLHLHGGRVQQGDLVRVGADFVVLRHPGGDEVTVPIAAIAVVQTRPGDD
jgi:hypothetical protein